MKITNRYVEEVKGMSKTN